MGWTRLLGGALSSPGGLSGARPPFTRRLSQELISLRGSFQNVGSHHTGMLAHDGHQLSGWPGCSLPHCRASASAGVCGTPRSAEDSSGAGSKQRACTQHPPVSGTRRGRVFALRPGMRPEPGASWSVQMPSHTLAHGGSTGVMKPRPQRRKCPKVSLMFSQARELLDRGSLSFHQPEPPAVCDPAETCVEPGGEGGSHGLSQHLPASFPLPSGSSSSEVLRCPLTPHSHLGLHRCPPGPALRNAGLPVFSPRNGHCHLPSPNPAA